MPLAITIGYRAKGSKAAPEVLYCGLSASEAYAVQGNPPEGIVRTAVVFNPTLIRYRNVPAPVVPVVGPEKEAEIIEEFEAAAEKVLPTMDPVVKESLEAVQQVAKDAEEGLAKILKKPGGPGSK